MVKKEKEILHKFLLLFFATVVLLPLFYIKMFISLDRAFGKPQLDLFLKSGI